jgi:hypothetical protein
VIDSDDQLRSITQWKKPKVRTPDRLGSLMAGYMREEVSPHYRQFSSAEQAWRQVVPDELAPHCWCDSVSNGQLKVIVDSPAYMYTLQTMRGELIERLKQLCRRPRIREIKFVPKP